MAIEIREIVIRARIDGEGDGSSAVTTEKSLTRDVRELVLALVNAEAAVRRREQRSERRREKFDR